MKNIKKILFSTLISAFVLTLITSPVNAAEFRKKYKDENHLPLTSLYSKRVSYVDAFYINYYGITTNQARYLQKELNDVMHQEILESEYEFLDTDGQIGWRTRYWLREFKAKYELPVNDELDSQTIYKLNEAYNYRKVLIRADTLNVRNIPGTSGSTVIGQLHRGDLVCIYGDSDIVNGITWYKVLYEGQFGYISGHPEYTRTTFVEVDIPSQTLRLYDDTILYLDTPVTTGKKDGIHDTLTGYFKIYFIDTDRTLQPSGAFVRYWMRFTENGQGLHDASWRDSDDVFNYFGGVVYKTQWAEAGSKYTGSHGCVNIPSAVMPYIFNHPDVGIGTPVYVHQ